MKRILCLLAAILALAASAPAQDIKSLKKEFEKSQKAEQHQQVIEIGNKLLPLLNDEKDCATIMNGMAMSYYSLGDNTKAVELGTRVVEIRKRILGENHSDYATSLNNLANYYCNLGDYEKAIKLGMQAMEIYKLVYGKNHPDYATSLGNLANYYHYLGDNNKAIELGMEAMELHMRIHGEAHPNYALSLNNLANYYSALGNYTKAIELGTQAMEISKKIHGKKHPNYAQALGNLALYNYYLGEYAKAIELEKQTMEIRKKTLGENHPIYATSLNNLALYYSNLSDYTKAIELGTQAMEIYKRSLGEAHPNYATAMSSLASNYCYLGDYTKAVELGTQAMEIHKRVLGESHPSYAQSLGNLAGYYSDLGDYAKAIELEIQTMEIRKRIFGENHPDYASSLNNLAYYYSEVGDYSKAIELCTKVVEIRKRILGENHPSYALSLNNLATFYSNLGNYAKAMELGTQAMEIQKCILGENHPDYARSLNNLATFYFELGDYTKAIKLGTQALEIRKRIFGENHTNYANALGNLANYHSTLGDLGKAIELGSKAMEIRKRTLGESHPDYATSMSNLSCYYYDLGSHEKAIDLLRSSLNASRNHLFKNLSELPARERASLWNTKSYAFQTRYPKLIAMSPKEGLVGDLYDKSCLFAKGLLLAAETDMRQLILESGDEKAVAKFEQLQTTRRWLNKLYELPIAERRVNTDSLENVSERLEGELVRMSKAYGDFMGNMKLTWRDVQKKLGNKDIAVEFLSFPVSKDSTQYIALTVKKGYDAPRLTKLFSEQELDAIETSFYTEKELSQLVWGRLAGELEGVENIYFSPSGELYNIAIESVPHWSGAGMMGDHYGLYRLSSTRELAISRDETPSKGAVVYGGIQYDTDVAHMGTPRTDAESLYAARGLNLSARNALRNIGWKDLKGTKEEADKISDILKGSKVSTSELTGAGATETTVKDLSGQKRRILHIATHGFYWDEEDAEYFRERDKLRFLMTDDKGKRHVEDKALTRSGLIFAGAQNTFNGKEIPAGVDDGVLTAQEIAQLDLRGLDLLVLSACQTGLGDVKGDGVFGLQRGFKKAGARTILMSLREVDDAATRDMMIQFYNAYAAGGSKRDAFLHAQQYLKDHDADYSYGSPTERADNPHWAAFILLDP